MQKEKQTPQIKNNPYDRMEWEGCLLHCSKCGASILPWPVNMTWPEYFYDQNRVAPIIEHLIQKHKSVCVHSGGTLSSILPVRKKTEQTENRLEDPAPFRMGMWCINVESGHLWQIDTARDLEVVTGGWENGKRNVKPYV